MNEGPENDINNPYKPLFVKTIEEIIDDEYETNNRLEEMTIKENKKNVTYDTNIFKKSLTEIINDMSTELLSAFEELVEKPNDISIIFSKNNRLTYIGIMIMLLSSIYYVV
jgi:L-lactate utilization protein LutC